MPQQQGSLIQHDYFENTGGLNNTTSPFNSDPNQSENGRNYDYIRVGGIRKRFGLEKVNSVADAQLKSLGLAKRETKTGTIQTIRAAGTKIQSVASTFTNLSEDTSTASTDFLTSGSTQPVTKSMFSTASADVLWLAGGGMSTIYGVYSSSKVTANGVAAPTGSIGTAVGGSGGTFSATGTYFYSVAFRKASTQALSNASLDQSATISATTQEVTITLSSINNNDTTKYDKIYIYRSAVGGVTGFTTGDLVAIVDSTDSNYVDTGTAELEDENVPRAGNTVLDNSELPSGTYKILTTFKRRLVTVEATTNTLLISDQDKPESWPLHNRIQLPSAGEATGLGVISFNTPTTTALDEILAIFKQNEFRVLTGTGTFDENDVVDWNLLYIDAEGCIAHNSIVNANGYMFWLNERGFFLWDGSGKPIYISPLVESYFKTDGDVNKTVLNLAWGQFYKKENQILWYMSHKLYGEQKFGLKLDLKLTLPTTSGNLGQRVIEGRFTPETTGVALYAGNSHATSTTTAEDMFVGDDAGFVYKHYTVANDASSAITFEYETQFLDQERPGTDKAYHQVIVWVEDLGDWDLQLDFWTAYRSSDPDKSSLSQRISTGMGSTIAVWDVAFWDVAFWDDYTAKLKPLVFNLRSTKNNITGECIKLRFVQSGADEPITIYGYSVLYSVIGETK